MKLINVSPGNRWLFGKEKSKYTAKEKELTEKLFKKLITQKTKNPKWTILSFASLYKLLNTQEKILLKQIANIDQKQFNKPKRFFGIMPVPKDIVAIKNQKYTLDGQTKTVATQFLPKKTFLAYKKLNEAMHKDINRKVNVLSGYRSPANQLAIFFLFIQRYKGDIKKTISGVALPGCSEHGYPPMQAIDFAPVKGMKHLRDFYKTLEYKWLQKKR